MQFNGRLKRTPPVCPKLPWAAGLPKKMIFCETEASETSLLEFLARRIQLCGDPSLLGHFLYFSKKLPKNENGAWITTLIDAPWQELFICGLRSAVAFLVSRIFCASIWDGQSSCTQVPTIGRWYANEMVCIQIGRITTKSDQVLSRWPGLQLHLCCNRLPWG